MLTENVAKICGGSYMKMKLLDILHHNPKDDRTSDEIISHIKEKLKGGEGLQ